jgi:hypothetical protein
MQGYNGKPRRTNKLGVVGVTPSQGKFKATLRCVHLGYFDTIEQAIEARKNAWDKVEAIKAHQREKGIISGRQLQRLRA